MRALGSGAAEAPEEIRRRAFTGLHGCGGRSALDTWSAAVFRDQAFQERQHPRLVAGACLLLQFIDRAGEDGVIGGARRGEAQGRVFGRHGRLCGVEQRLVQFFARPQPDKPDLDIAVGAQPGEPDHLPRQIDDLTGSPMSRTKILPRAIISAAVSSGAGCAAEASSTSSTASRTVIKNRVTSGWVTVSGPPTASWRVKSGTTDPVEPSTLPKRTVTKRVPPARTR